MLPVSSPTRRARLAAPQSRLAPSTARSATDHVAEAAREAVKGAGFDLLLVLGFAFDAPRPGMIAVKVINHHGDEVLKTYELSA